jgi:4'-phosphopantetheinyl transferase
MDGSPLALPQSNEVHIWQMSLAAVADCCSQWQIWLSPEERDRAQRFRRALDRDRFLCGRGGLRFLLARYLGCAPEVPVFTYGEYGKPELAQPAAGLYFNLAHSGQWVVYGFSWCRVIGVDVEEIAPRTYLEDLIRRCLTPQEQMSLPLAAPERLHRFFQHWTLKEAHLKAVGMGLSYGLDQVQIAWQPQPVLVQGAPVEGQPVTDWTIDVWQPDGTAIAAVCVGQPHHTLTRRPFPVMGANGAC